MGALETMTQQSAGPGPAHQGEDEISLLALGSVLLRRRRTIVTLGLLGSAAGLATGLLATRVYKSSAKFLPQVSDVTSPSLSGLVSQWLWR